MLIGAGFVKTVVLAALSALGLSVEIPRIYEGGQGNTLFSIWFVLFILYNYFGQKKKEKNNETKCMPECR